MTTTSTAPTDVRVDLLILGAGWTSTFLIPLCISQGISYAATSRPARPKPGTVPFEFDEHDPTPDPKTFASLPRARTVLVTFPVTVEGATERLVRLYQETHEESEEGKEGRKTGFVQLGSTGIWEGDGPTAQDNSSTKWVDRHSPYNQTNARARAEAELLALAPDTPTTVLNLCGLFGGARAIKNVVGRVAPTKEALKTKGSIHMIHGTDVARAIVAVHTHFDRATGERWMLTNGRVYDWWDLASTFGDAHTTQTDGAPGQPTRSLESGEAKGPHPRWVRELMREEGVRALPRSVEQLGRGLDSREFWDTFELEPLVARLE